MRTRHASPLQAIGITALAALSLAAQAATSCVARSGSGIAPVVELYTSEGCNSCPPADRWLSGLKAEPGVVALAFHVDYWDRLGWKDRFASPAYAQRQAQQQASSAARFSYTPQVLLDGADRPDWPRLDAALAARAAASVAPTAPVEVSLVREGNHFRATVAALNGAPARLSAYWAVTEQGHVSAVKAGENEGVTLRHDHVVREYLPVTAWASKPEAGTTTLAFDPATPIDPAHAREVVLVIVNAASGRPVQALRLGC
ncbi:MAG: DUF1223 domain-containing protein [Rhizobacter sp.]|nr:DUF1223 domain-containing protein [Rhizobacter sp.]